MKCSTVTAFLSQVFNRQTQLAFTPGVDLNYLSQNGYIAMTSQDGYNKAEAEVARLSDMISQAQTHRLEVGQAAVTLQRDQQRDRSFLIRFQGQQAKEELGQRIQSETAALSAEESEQATMEANVNQLIQEKSVLDRMMPYDGQYVSLTDLGTVILKDLSVRNYRVADEEFADFLVEVKATYDELRSMADRGRYYASVVRPEVPEVGRIEDSEGGQVDAAYFAQRVQSISWGVAIGLAKLQGDPTQIAERFTQALGVIQAIDSSTTNKLMAAEIMTATGSQDLQSLQETLKNLVHQIKSEGVPKEERAGVAATIMAGKRFDGSYPTDRFDFFSHRTPSYEAASLLAVMSVAPDALTAKFQDFRNMFNSWGYMRSEDTEMASAFLAIGELGVSDVDEKLKYIVEQLKNYLEYPLVAAAILAAIPVFEAHEVLDLMEKAVTVLTDYAGGLERSELVALAVRMIHGVRNELVKQIDPTAKFTPTPVQFGYPVHPGLFLWYYPVIIAHSSYYSTFSGMGAFHPAHAHGVGGFAG